MITAQSCPQVLQEFLQCSFPKTAIEDTVPKNTGGAMKIRILGSVVGALAGFLVGGGTGIVGGVFGAMAGVLVFTTIGAAWGWSAGPDLERAIQKWRRK